MITAKSLTNGTLTLIVDNGAQILTARNDHPRWKEIIDAFKANNDSLLQSLVSLKAVVETYSVGQLSLNSTGVTFQGKPMHGVDSDRVMAFLRDGLPYKPIANYMARKMANPSTRAIKEMYNFLEHKNMPLTNDGHIIAYKCVCEDFYSVQGNKSTVVITGETDSNGRILNTVGQVIEVERSSVDDDFRVGCSFGLHAGSLSYAKGWGKRVIFVEIDPADVVSVPSDCNCQKLRCCKYKVIGEYTGPLPDTYTSEFSLNDESKAEPKVESDALQVPPTQNEHYVHSLKEIISDRCKELICELSGIDTQIITNESTWMDVGMDSLDGVELVMALEEDLENKKFKDLVDYIYRMIVPVTSLQNGEGAFANGFLDALRDKSQNGKPKYLAGDETGADSGYHELYILGYVSAFKYDCYL